MPADKQRRFKIRAVILPAKINKRVIAFFPHAGNNGLNGLFHLGVGLIAVFEPLGGFDPFLFISNVQDTTRHGNLISIRAYNRIFYNCRDMGQACHRKHGKHIPASRF